MSKKNKFFQKKALHRHPPLQRPQVLYQISHLPFYKDQENDQEMISKTHLHRKRQRNSLSLRLICAVPLRNDTVDGIKLKGENRLRECETIDNLHPREECRRKLRFSIRDRYRLETQFYLFPIEPTNLRKPSDSR